MATTEGRGEWLALRARQQLFDTLQQMAERYAATAHLYPLPVDDMSPAEKLSLHLLPEHLRPAGLPTEAEIWAEYRARCKLQQAEPLRLADLSLVVDDENQVSVAAGDKRVNGCGSFGSAGDVDGRQINPKTGAPARFGVEDHEALVVLHDSPDRG